MMLSLSEDVFRTAVYNIFLELEYPLMQWPSFKDNEFSYLKFIAAYFNTTLEKAKDCMTPPYPYVSIHYAEDNNLVVFYILSEPGTENSVEITYCPVSRVTAIASVNKRKAIDEMDCEYP